MSLQISDMQAVRWGIVSAGEGFQYPVFGHFDLIVYDLLGTIGIAFADGLGQRSMGIVHFGGAVTDAQPQMEEAGQFIEQVGDQIHQSLVAGQPGDADVEIAVLPQKVFIAFNILIYIAEI